MASNIALRRAAKANRRKAIVAEKRKSELLAATLPEKVRRAASMPIQYCLVSGGLFDLGLGTVILARGSTADHLTMGIFLVDVFCLGIKDVAFKSMAGADFEEYTAVAGASEPSVRVDPGYARKLLRDVAVWAQFVGFAPPQDFAVVERIFGDVSADTCDVAFQFGRDGKPFYMPGPSESPTQVRRRMEQLRARFGEEAVDFAAPL
jgi:hypothetical protein